MIALPPSGAQYRLVSGDQEATVVEVGGGLRAFTVGGEPVLDGYEVHEMASGGRGQHLIPWPNRIGDGKYRFAGTDLQLPLSEPSRHNASHGLVRWANWRASVQDADRVVMELTLHPQPGYPFTLGLSSSTASERGGSRWPPPPPTGVTGPVPTVPAPTRT